MLRPSALTLLLVASLPLPFAACGDKRPPPGAPPPVPVAITTRAAVKPATVPAPTKEARRSYRKQLAAGRKLATAQKWGEAVVAFEAALAAIPLDGRALSELAWAAFNAGDYAKARKAGIASVLAVTQPKAKASALYNLGRVEEATTHREQAAKLYQQSLALRPSKTVADRLAGLGKDAAGDKDAAESERFCTEARPAEQVCACIDAFASYWDQDADPSERSCELGPEHEPGVAAIDGLRLAHAKMSHGSESHLLLARAPGGWSVVATLEDVYDPGLFGISEDWKLVSMSEEQLGDRRIVKIVTEHHRQDSDLGIDEVEAEDATNLTICVLGNAPEKTLTSCPLRVPLASSYGRERLGLDDDELDAETRKLQTPGLPIHHETALRVDLAPDGGATVVLVKGALAGGDKRLLGPHRLW